MPVNVDELRPEDRRRLGLRVPRKVKLVRNDVRTHALRVLAVVADLTRDERRRVLQHALRVNEV